MEYDEYKEIRKEYFFKSKMQQPIDMNFFMSYLLPQDVIEILEITTQ